MHSCCPGGIGTVSKGEWLGKLMVCERYDRSIRQSIRQESKGIIEGEPVAPVGASPASGGSRRAVHAIGPLVPLRC